MTLTYARLKLGNRSRRRLRNRTHALHPPLRDVSVPTKRCILNTKRRRRAKELVPTVLDGRKDKEI